MTMIQFGAFLKMCVTPLIPSQVVILIQDGLQRTVDFGPQELAMDFLQSKGMK